MSVCRRCVQSLSECISLRLESLQQGYGHNVCRVLHALLSELLREKDWRAPLYEELQTFNDFDVGSYSESDADIHSEDAAAVANEDDYYDYDYDYANGSDDGPAVENPQIDHQEWQLELDRVSKKLYIEAEYDGYDWRGALERFRGPHKLMKDLLNGGQLETLSSKLSNQLKYIHYIETKVNIIFEDKTSKLWAMSASKARIKARISELTQSVDNLRVECNSVSEELKDHKAIVGPEFVPRLKVTFALQARAQHHASDVALRVAEHMRLRVYNDCTTEFFRSLMYGVSRARLVQMVFVVWKNEVLQAKAWLRVQEETYAFENLRTGIRQFQTWFRSQGLRKQH